MSSRQSNNAALLRELTVFCQSDSLSEDGLREIIERHGVAPNNNDINNNNYDFFLSTCLNERVTEGILRYLLQYFPNAAAIPFKFERLPLHSIICYNKNVTLGMVQLLIDAYPGSLRHESEKGLMPLHKLCHNDDLDDEVGLEILKLLIEKCPEAVKHTAEGGRLPIHLAAGKQSPQFCRLLVEAYPRSEQMTTNEGALPFHSACRSNTTVATVKYLHKLYPESINVATNIGRYPIHCAMLNLKECRDRNHKSSIKMVQFLLDCNPNVMSQKHYDKLPFYLVCKMATNKNTRKRKLNAYFKVLQIMYDAQPEVIDEVASNVGRFSQEVQIFINTKLFQQVNNNKKRKIDEV